MKSKERQKSRLPRIKPKEGTYWCRRCGGENSGTVKYTETQYGVVNIHTIINGDVEYGDDWETVDTDNHEAYAYECDRCGYQGDAVAEVFTSVMSTPLVARCVLVRMIEERDSSWAERDEMWKRLKPIAPWQEKGKEVEYDEKVDG